MVILDGVLLLLLFFVAFYVLNREVGALTRAVRSPITGTPGDMGLAYQDVSFTTEDGLKISGWYIPGRRAEGIIVVHGVDANKQGMLPIGVTLAEAGYHVLLIDLRGHGASEGEQLSYGYREALDVQAAVAYLLELPEVERVGALGFSLGGAVVSRAAAGEERLSAIIIESTFSSLSDAVESSFSQYTGWPKWPFAPILTKSIEWKLGLAMDQVDSARDLAAMPPRPILIIHGSSDDLFSVEHAYRLYEAAQPPKDLWIIEGLGHAYPREQNGEYSKRIVKFFDEAFNG